MAKIARWSMEMCSQYVEDGYEMRMDKDGEYVEYADHAAMIAELEDECEESAEEVQRILQINWHIDKDLATERTKYEALRSENERLKNKQADIACAMASLLPFDTCNVIAADVEQRAALRTAPPAVGKEEFNDHRRYAQGS